MHQSSWRPHSNPPPPPNINNQRPGRIFSLQQSRRDHIGDVMEINWPTSTTLSKSYYHSIHVDKYFSHGTLHFCSAPFPFSLLAIMGLHNLLSLVDLSSFNPLAKPSTFYPSSDIHS